MTLKNLKATAAQHGLQVEVEETGLTFAPRQYHLTYQGQKVGLVWAPTRKRDTWNAQETVRHRGAWGGVTFDAACRLIAAAAHSLILTRAERFTGDYADSWVA